MCAGKYDSGFRTKECILLTTYQDYYLEPRGTASVSHAVIGASTVTLVGVEVLGAPLGLSDHYLARYLSTVIHFPSSGQNWDTEITSSRLVNMLEWKWDKPGSVHIHDVHLDTAFDTCAEHFRYSDKLPWHVTRSASSKNGQLRDDRRKLAELRTVPRVPEEFANLDGSTSILAPLVVEILHILTLNVKLFSKVQILCRVD